MRRYAAEGTAAGHDSLLKLLQAAPNENARSSLWPAVLTGWLERGKEATTLDNHPLNQLLTTELIARPEDLTLLRLAVLVGRRDAISAVVKEAFSEVTDSTRRTALLTILTPVADTSLAEPAFSLLTDSQPEGVQTAALQLTAAANGAGNRAPTAGDPSRSSRWTTAQSLDRCPAFTRELGTGTGTGSGQR
ncbi:MAG UNVERIFIED_CONTAM: hypothetical protein LVR18_33085 [Planctomycetaceae bacterium]